MTPPPGRNPGIAFDPTLLQNAGQANASIGGVPLRINPNSVSLPYQIKMHQDQTVGGMVIQIYGVQWGDLTVSGQFGAGGWKAQKDFFDQMKSLATSTAQTQFQQQLAGVVASSGSFRFFFPLLNYDFQVFLKNYSTADGQGSVVLTNATINPSWQLTFSIDNDNNGLATVVQDAYVSRLAAGVGYGPGQYPGQYNGPASGDDITNLAAKSGLSVGQLLVQSFGLSPTDATAAEQSLAGSGAANAATSLSGNSNAQQVYNFFIQKGLSKYAAAGFVGNFMQESGCDPERHQDNGGPGRGIAQWELGGRWKPELETGDASTDLLNQLNYVWQELNGSTYSKVLAGLPSLTNVTDTTTFICNNYEGPSVASLPKRIGFAQSALSQFGGGSP
jgi:hypothetical protein